MEEKSKWLKSPFTQNANRLKPMRELVVMPYQGRRRRLKVFRTHYVIGSAGDCDIRLEDPFVCPRHAELRLDESGYSIADLGSKNGVFLSGVRVKSAPLPAQGSLRLGRSQFHWRQEAEGASEEDGWIMKDPGTQEIFRSVKRAARSGLPVLLVGETGTGKEVLARLIHRNSARHGRPCVTMNGALAGGPLAESELFGHTKGAFTGADKSRRGALRSAHGGSLFLDEVADLPMSAQIKLLRALESGEVKPLGSDEPEKSDFRLIAATSQDLERKIAEGEFRLDLYYRIAGFVVHVPPLRERPLDILAIARAELALAGMDLHRESEGKLLSYSWPGNVRELRACLGRAVVSAREDGSGLLLPDHIEGLERQLPPKRESSRTLAEAERDCIRASLERNGWAKGVSAKELGIARSTLAEKMRRYSLKDISP